MENLQETAGLVSERHQAHVRFPIRRNRPIKNQHRVPHVGPQHRRVRGLGGGETPKCFKNKIHQRPMRRFQEAVRQKAKNSSGNGAKSTDRRFDLLPRLRADNQVRLRAAQPAQVPVGDGQLPRQPVLQSEATFQSDRGKLEPVLVRVQRTRKDRLRLAAARIT